MGTVKEFIQHHYRHFNAAVVIDAAQAYVDHLESGGKMFMTLAGASEANAATGAIVQAVKLGLRGESVDSELLRKMSGPIRFAKGSRLRSKIPAR